MTKKYIKKMLGKLLGAMFFASLLCSAADATSIEFSLDDIDTSSDLTALLSPISRITSLDKGRYEPLAAGYLLQDMDLLLNSGDLLRIMLVCASPAPSGALRDIQLLLVDDRKDTPKVLQRIKLGDGEAPQLLTGSGASGYGDIMLRVIRTGNNSEAYVYSVNRAAGRLTESLAINRSFPERMKLSISGKMQQGGFVEVQSKNPAVSSVMDMSDALDAMIDDELYQPNGRPIASQANLVCVRNGWEDERISVGDDGSVTVEVGLSLITSARRQVADVVAVLAKAGINQWEVRDIRFEPFLPYRW